MPHIMLNNIIIIFNVTGGRLQKENKMDLFLVDPDWLYWIYWPVLFYHRYNGVSR